MKKQEVLSKLLIQPKELVLKDGFFKKSSDYQVFTNIDTDFSYLLELAGFKSDAKKVYYDLNDIFVIAIGESHAPL